MAARVITFDRVVVDSLRLYKLEGGNNVHVDGEYIVSASDGSYGQRRQVIDAPLTNGIQTTLNNLWAAAETRARQAEGLA